MRGIVAAAAGSNIVPVLVEGLKKLEYRGYDSAGLAVISGDGIELVRAVGRVAELAAASAGTTATLEFHIDNFDFTACRYPDRQRIEGTWRRPIEHLP